MDMAPPKYVSPSGEHIVIRVPSGTVVPCKVVGVEVHKKSYRLVMEVPELWIAETKEKMP